MSSLRKLFFVVILAMVLPWLITAMPQQKKDDPTPEIKPEVPTANRNLPGRIFLEHADRMLKNERDSFIVLVGNVYFTKGGMNMYCDSAHYTPETESMDAFGNIKMEQGDTLFIYGDELNYDGIEEIAYLYGDYREVRLINRDVMLETMEFVYDLKMDLGYYNVGGRLTDAKNRLVSQEGEYIPSTKEANFYTNVHLHSADDKDTLDIYTDTLFYNTDTHVALLYSPSKIVNAQATIFTENGMYNTDTNVGDLFDRSIVTTPRGNILIGDTLFYDRQAGYGEAFGNMVLIDSIRSLTLTGEYGYYNELTDSAYVTGRARAIEYSKKDTLYMHGRQIETFRMLDTIRIPEDTINNIEASEQIDTLHVLVCYPRVRFYRSDMQGICDSLRFEEIDSTLYMHRHPVVWSGDREVFGKTISVHLNDSTIDKAHIEGNAFSSQHVDEEFYDQISGKTMDAYFDDGELVKLDVSGNVEAIMMPQENDSTYNKIVQLESSFLSAWFKDQQMLRMKTWPESTVTSTPLFLTKRSMYYLKNFRWYEALRPRDPDDIFTVEDYFEEFLDSPE